MTTNKEIIINVDEVKRLAGLGLTLSEIALALGISEDTLSRRRKKYAEFADAVNKGKGLAKEEIANKLFELAKSGDLGALIWIEKTRFGYSDKLNIDAGIKLILCDESD
jgi:hypothetical protein